jgi:hypothetical protein
MGEKYTGLVYKTRRFVLMKKKYKCVDFSAG